MFRISNVDRQTPETGTFSHSAFLQADGTWEYPEEEGILRIDFVREVEGLLEELEEQQREFAKNTSFTAEAIAARFVFEQKMRTAAQLRKLRRNAAMVEV
jgi:uncharacterized radical SAM superfamily Fe-S cluster-containing enzyme